jgi:hypothetical protein
MHPKAKQALQEIGRSETKGLAEKALDVFLDTYALKYPKTTACLQKDREEPLRCSIRFQLPIGSVCELRISSNRPLERFGIGQPARRGV